METIDEDRAEPGNALIKIYTSFSHTALTTFLPYLEIVLHLNRATISFLDIELVVHEECVLLLPTAQASHARVAGKHASGPARW